MDKLAKFLDRLTAKEKKGLKPILIKLKRLEFGGLDIEKLKNAQDLYRIRKGDFRIIYMVRDGVVYILTIERRSDNTYK